MNTGFYENLDTNFAQALEMSEKDFSHTELMELLQSGNIPQKQIAAIKLDNIYSKHEADILTANLTGCDGKIREAVALKINQLLIKNSDISIYFTNAEVFADASIDINANICRLVIDSAAILILNEKFSTTYSHKILDFIREALEGLDKIIYRDKKYVINKQLFKLYWSLEALKLFANILEEDVLLPILDRTSKEREYTIREKTAQIILRFDSDKYNTIKNRLQYDENYYVRQVLN